jgi:hypothetical protein
MSTSDVPDGASRGDGAVELTRLRSENAELAARLERVCTTVRFRLGHDLGAYYSMVRDMISMMERECTNASQLENFELIRSGTLALQRELAELALWVGMEGSATAPGPVKEFDLEEVVARVILAHSGGHRGRIMIRHDTFIDVPKLRGAETSICMALGTFVSRLLARLDGVTPAPVSVSAACSADTGWTELRFSTPLTLAQIGSVIDSTLLVQSNSVRERGHSAAQLFAGYGCEIGFADVDGLSAVTLRLPLPLTWSAPVRGGTGGA